MRKCTKFAALAAVLTMSVAAFAGCGSQEAPAESSAPVSEAVVESSTPAENEAVLGIWNMNGYIDENGELQTASQIEENLDVDLEGQLPIIEFKADNTAVLKAGEITQTGTYGIVDNVVTFVVDETTGISSEDEESVASEDNVQTTYVFELDAEAGTLTLKDEKIGLNAILTKEGAETGLTSSTESEDETASEDNAVVGEEDDAVIGEDDAMIEDME